MTRKEHLALHDRQIRAIGELVQEGMRLVIETRTDIRTILQIQKRTGRKLERLVNRLSRGPNAHDKKA